MQRLIHPAVIIVHLALCLAVPASDSPPTAFLKAHCLDCHDQDDPKGKLDVSALSFPPTSATDFKTWVHILDRVEAGEMPPKRKDGSPRLALAQSETFRAVVGKSLQAYDLTRQQRTGRVASRHLTRFEYQRTMEALLGIDTPLTDDLPDDLSIASYDTVTQFQAMSQYHLSHYLAAADRGLQFAIIAAAEANPPFKKTYSQKELARRNFSVNERGPVAYKEKDVIAGNWTGNGFHGRLTGTDVPTSGWYRITLSVQGVNIPKGHDHLWGSIRSGVCFSSLPAQYFIGRFPATEHRRTVSFEAWIRARHILEIKMQDMTHRGVSGGRYTDEHAFANPGIAYRDLTIERINKGQPAKVVKHILFGDVPVTFEVEKPDRPSRGDRYAQDANIPRVTVSAAKSVSEKDLAPLITAFATRAFRRPMTATDCAPYIELAKAQYRDQQSFVDALLTAYRTILVSPRFLYFEEQPGRLDGYALANRLSYFLTGRQPDADLLLAAERNQLQTASHLRSQAERLLSSPDHAAALNHFVDQWLMLTQIDATTPDGKTAPTYDDSLKYAMMDEPRAFIRHLIAADKPARDLVAADYTIIDSRLASLYDIPWTGEPHVRVVTLPKTSPRGGLMTQAAILKVTANGTSTSPVVRGMWMLERLMGVHVPPPPDNVPAIEPDTRGAASIREILIKHREESSCAACHRKIDPPGFALESFDVIGQYRTAYKTDNKKSTLPIDPGATMHDRRSFADINEFRALLAKGQRDTARTFLEHLTTFATGASITYADRAVIAGILDRCAPHYGLRSLTLELVTSPLFTHK